MAWRKQGRSQLSLPQALATCTEHGLGGKGNRRAHLRVSLARTFSAHYKHPVQFITFTF